MSEYLPFEIQVEILKRLPLKPLLQFRSVSKSFKCLIDSPDFVIAYSVDHPQQPHDRYILRYSKFADDIYRYITFGDNDSYIRYEFIHPVPDLIKTFKPRSASVVGRSHGLLCFSGKYPDGHSGRTEMVVLWNPSIRKSVGIRAPYIYDKPNENFYNVRFHKFFGFGVCPVTFDPTILKIECIDYKRKRNDRSRITAPWKVLVFTLSTGTWRILSTNLPRESIILDEFKSQVVIDRFIYWIAYDMLHAEDGRSQSQTLIMSFDLTAKEFKEINLPDNLANRHCSIQSISKLRDSLVLLAFRVSKSMSGSCLWMMKEQGVSRSFTKLYTIKLPDVTINQILGFRKTGELIMETRSEGRNAYVQIYKWNCKHTQYLCIDGEDNSFFMCSYKETLLLLDKSDGSIYPSIVHT